MDRAKVPTRMTYRAVGSSTGIKEFMGEESDEYSQMNHFGSGDISLDADQYESISKTEDMLHLPVVLGAISLFHSIPNVPGGSSGLNMTSCLLARIMKREIKDWLHPDIVTKNPNLEMLIGQDQYPVKVARRVLGSSSTKSVTAYLHASCPEHWGSDMVGKELGDKWPADTMECEGSGGMTDCIRDNPGTIGYIDAGHGHSQNLIEIELQNKNGNYISSLQSDELGGIGYAAEASEGLPSSPMDDFSKVDLLNQEGDVTWPIVAMSYIYVKKDWTTPRKHDMMDHWQQELLFAFLQALYTPSYIDECKELFGFTPAYTNTKLKALADMGLESIIMDANATKWIFESNTMPYIGQKQNIISVKRRSNAEYERSQLTAQLQNLQTKFTALELSQKAAGTSAKSMMASDAKTFADKNNTELTVSLACSIVSIVLWILFLAKTIFCGTAKANNKENSYNGGEVVARNGTTTTKAKQSRAEKDEEEMV